MKRQQELETNQAWEERVQELAASFHYPATPDNTVTVRQRLRPATRRPGIPRLVWAAVVVLLLLAALLAVPQVRAAVLRIFQIGAITVFEADELPVTSADIWANKPAPPLIVAQELATQMTLAEAQAALRTDLFLPTYPADLGEPDAVYLADGGWPQTVIFVWAQPTAPAETRLALYQIGANQFGYKGAPVVEETAVNGQRALWLEGPHTFFLADNSWDEWQFIESSVLVWYAASGTTFRLEGASTLTEAIRIAESLEKIEE